MKIERVEAIALRIPLTKIFSGSTYRVDSRCTVITRLYAGGLVSEVQGTRIGGSVSVVTDERLTISAVITPTPNKFAKPA